MIVLISGKQGSGKSTLAKMLRFILLDIIRNKEYKSTAHYNKYICLNEFDSNNENVAIASFATPIRYIAQILAPIDFKKDYKQFKDEFTHYHVHGKVLTGRELLIHIGRKIAEDDNTFITDAVLAKTLESKIVIVDDLRLNKELTAIMTSNHPMYLIRMDGVKYSTDNCIETELDNLDDRLIDYRISDLMPLENLFKVAKEIAHNILII